MYQLGLVSISFRSLTPRQLAEAVVAAGLKCIEWGSDVHAPCDNPERLQEIVALQKEFGITYLFISHDLSVVEHISDTVGVMYLGNMVELAPTEKLFAKPLHPYTQALFSAIPVPDPDFKMDRVVLEGSIPSPANPPAGCKFHTRCSKCMEVCKHFTPELQELEGEHFCACHLYNSPERQAELEAAIPKEN